MKQKNAYRHGDVVITPTKEKIQGEKQNELVLALGEITGHSHRIVEGNAELFRWNEKTYLRVKSKIAKIDHEEHGIGCLSKGDYEITIQQEWKEDGWTKVLD